MGLGINRTHRTRGIHAHNAYEFFQDVIFRETGIDCRVFVKNPGDCAGWVSIKTPGPQPEKYAQFLVARNAIKGMTELEIRHDFFE